jgi:hypothetical protein
MLSTGWGPWVDGGAGNPAQGAPFQLWGGTVCSNPSDVSWISVDPASGMTMPGGASEVEVTLDSTGVPAGHYVAYLCLYSDDPTSELIVMPVHMTVTETSYLQVAHLAPFAMDPGTAVTITLNGIPALTDFAYGDSTGYIELPSGEYDVEVWPAGSDSPAIAGTIELVHGMYYSAIAYGDGVNQALGLMLLEDDNTAPAAGKFHLRLGHLAPFAEGLATADIRLQDGTPILEGVNFTDVTGYIELDAGEYDLKITTPGGETTLIDPLPVDFAEGATVTAFATGDAYNQDVGVFAWPPDMEGFFLPLAEYGVELHVAMDEMTAVVGSTVTYTVHITNTGNAADVFYITAMGVWAADAPTMIELDAGEMGMFYVTVDIPEDAADGDFDVTTITATSQEDPAVSDSVTATTTAEVEEYILFLPIIIRP